MFNILRKKETALPLIVNMMAEYLSEEEKKTKSPFISIKSAKEKYGRLVALGLSKSTNAKELKTIIDNQQLYNENILKAKGLIEYIKEVNTILDKNSYLISFEQFEVVCKKYNLVYNLLEKYTGVIPEENISQIEKVSSKVKNIPSVNKDLYTIVSVSTEDGDKGRLFGEWCKKNRFLYLPSLRDPHYDGGYWRDDIALYYPECPQVSYSNMNCVVLYPVDKSNFLIAAPKTHFEDDFKITTRSQDPIVFQTCPYGVLIHSVWGEEADDVTLAKYKKLLEL